MAFKMNNNVLNSIAKVTNKATTLSAEQDFNLKYINIKYIEPNKNNFYKLVNIEELANDILNTRLLENIVVKKINDTKYTLISGERRYTAFKYLVEHGHDKYQYIPCQVIENINEVDEELMLIQANALTRELSDDEKLEQVKKIEHLLMLKKKEGTFKGDIKVAIGETLGLKRSQVNRYQKINDDLIKPLRDLITDKKLNISSAAEFAGLSEESQKVVYESLDAGKVSVSKSTAESMVKMLKMEDKVGKKRNNNIIKLNTQNNSKKQNGYNSEIDLYLTEIITKLKTLENIINKSGIYDNKELYNKYVKMSANISSKISNLLQ